jgi:hypothetical protein
MCRHFAACSSGEQLPTVALLPVAAARKGIRFTQSKYGITCKPANEVITDPTPAKPAKQ